jgi:nucleoside triphosphate diphosphatase
LPDSVESSADQAAQAKNKRNAAALRHLLEIMAALRDPVHGCPWDQKQTFATIAPYTIEEAYEVADAIERGDIGDLKDELGDLLLQVVYHARIAQEGSFFDFADVAESISAKLIRRHPHVFGSERDKAEAVPGQWEAIKKAEREAKAAEKNAAPVPALFGDIAEGLPALAKSAKLQRRASNLGFDWPSIEPILEKVDEELLELRSEIEAAPSPETQRRQFEEFGDLMFVIVNLGLRLGIDSEAALRAANAKFVRRMEAIEASAQTEGRSLEGMTLHEMQALWDRVKETEQKRG